MSEDDFPDSYREMAWDDAEEERAKLQARAEQAERELEAARMELRVVKSRLNRTEVFLGTVLARAPERTRDSAWWTKWVELALSRLRAPTDTEMEA